MPKPWNPRARSCSKCPELKPIKDKISKTIDQQKKECEQWQWEIPNELAEKQAVCRMLPGDQKRQRRKQT